MSVVALPDGQSANVPARLAAWARTKVSSDTITLRPGDRVGGGAPCTAPGCARSISTRHLCSVHLQRWIAAGRPVGEWDRGPTVDALRLDLSVLPLPLRWEVAYAIAQSQEVDESPRVRERTLVHHLRALRLWDQASLLDADETAWPINARTLYNQEERGAKLRDPFLVFAIDELETLYGTATHEHEYRREVWRLRRLDVTGHARNWLFDFRPIVQPWLRDAARAFLRSRRTSEYSPSGMHRDLLTITRLGRALTQAAGPSARPRDLTRAVLGRFFALLIEDGLSPNGRRLALSSARVFLTTARRHGWAPGIPADSLIHPEDAPRHRALAPRALTEQVMAQLEDEANLDQLTDPRMRLLFPLLMQTGLRLNDALKLPTDCVTTDAAGAPYLRYTNHKMLREALVPISAELAQLIHAQAARARASHSPAAVLFPRTRDNAAGTRPLSVGAARAELASWIRRCDIRDDSGELAKVTAHQFRHTLGTRLINNDVPQEVVRRILDHSSTEMTAHYARLHDTTVRRQWERARKVDIHGNTVALEADSPLADARWTRHHVERAAMTLPNGYCGMPAQRACPHANACLTCPLFLTTPQFLPEHRKQLALTVALVDRATEAGQTRLAQTNQQVVDNLTTIITALETEEAPDAG